MLWALADDPRIRELEEYIRYNRTKRSAVLKTWQALQAYRAAVPVRRLPIYSELFCLKIELALISWELDLRAGAQDAASLSV